MHILSVVLCVLLLLPVSHLTTAKTMTSTRLSGTLSDSWSRAQSSEQKTMFNWPSRYTTSETTNKGQKTHSSKKTRNHIVSAHLILLLR